MIRTALFLMVAIHGWACSCGGDWPSAKGAWQRATVVFLGTVTSAIPGEIRGFEPQKVQLRVDEAFKGILKGQVIELNQGGTDCDAKFKSGQRAVFYLESAKGSYFVPWCTRATGSADAASDDLMFLHALPQSAEGARLSGEVELYEQSPTDSFKRVQGMQGVKVAIRGPGGTRALLTNGSGFYEVYGLKPGIYSVDIDVPQNLTIYFPTITGSHRIEGNAAAVELGKDTAASVSFVLMADTRLSGHMLDSQGAPVKGVCIELQPKNGRAQGGAFHFDCSEADGWFEMKQMPPGDYWLVAEDRTDPYSRDSKSTLYYPGVRDKRRAKMITIQEGSHIGSMEFRLPEGEKRFKISGRFEFADGTPIKDRPVVFTDPEAGYKETTSTAEDGSFSLLLISGMKGAVGGTMSYIAATSCPEFNVRAKQQGLFRYVEGDPVSVRADSDQKDVKLVLPVAPCRTSTQTNR